MLTQHGVRGPSGGVVRTDRRAPQLAMETMGEANRKWPVPSTVTTSWSSPTTTRTSTVDWWDRLVPVGGGHVRLVHQRDVIQTLSIADLLITDASSVASEYALLDRPSCSSTRSFSS